MGHELLAPPLSLYVHLPWCVRKCPYCDFNSHAAGRDAPRSRYLDALRIDMQAEAERADGRPLISIFLGGGTPSLFTPDEIGRLLDDISNKFNLTDDVEVTMEANPGTVECGDPMGYRQAGVNRLSIGAQSFRAQSLATLGRIHTVGDIERAVDEARAAGLTNINLDVMYALPGQGVSDAIYDLEQAIRLRPAHISWYQLTLEPNTVFYTRPPADMPDEDLSYEIMTQGQARLAASGYEQYEVSAYANSGKRCRHNLNYWKFGDYLAVGAGAHGKLSLGTEIWRYSKPANPQQYMEAMECGRSNVGLKALSGPERVFEFMLNVLRLTDGFDETLFSQRTGLQGSLIGDRLAGLRERRLIDEVQSGIWRVTGLGQRFLNDLQAEFLP
ncbi:MAG: radical SAM family heme chaperone HemW [Proteobacteria bacterium]|nr:radical SAM family heme chaperone HemW [Pseudomonadota bacterium]